MDVGSAILPVVIADDLVSCKSTMHNDPILLYTALPEEELIALYPEAISAKILPLVFVFKRKNQYEYPYPCETLTGLFFIDTKGKSIREERPMSIIESVVGILIGGGLLAFIQFLITRHDNRHDKFKTVLDAIKGVRSEVDDIRKEITALKDDANRRDATQARTHILRFRDELQNNMDHSGEYFDQILEDAERYEKFCGSHPDFPNGRTEAAIEYIKDEHQRLLKEHKL